MSFDKTTSSCSFLEASVAQAQYNTLYLSSLLTTSRIMDIETLLRQEFDSLKCKKPALDCLSKFKAACCPQNMCKNRYYNILPNEDSRVKLHALVEGDSDCIFFLLLVIMRGSGSIFLFGTIFFL